MKRIGAIACLTAVIVMLTASFAFGASSLKLVDNYPKDNQKNTTKENMCVKLTFNNEMSTKVVGKANKDCFTITDEKGKKLPIKIIYNPKEKGQVLVLADATKKLDIKDDAEYTLNISKDLVDDQGNKLGKDEQISFTTMNQGKSTKIYMIMMVIMFGGIFFFSSKQMKKHAQSQNQLDEKEEPFNPYKESKRTGKSVEEVIAAHEKEVAKREAKRAKRAAKQLPDDWDNDDIYENYRVKAPHTVASVGSTFKTGRKAEAEAKAAAKAAAKAKNNKKK